MKIAWPSPSHLIHRVTSPSSHALGIQCIYDTAHPLKPAHCLAACPSAASTPCRAHYALGLWVHSPKMRRPDPRQHSLMYSGCAAHVLTELLSTRSRSPVPRSTFASAACCANLCARTQSIISSCFLLQLWCWSLRCRSASSRAVRGEVAVWMRSARSGRVP